MDAADASSRSARAGGAHLAHSPRSTRLRRATLVLAALALATLAFAARADAFVYWTNYKAGTIGRANLDGSGVDQSFINTAVGKPYGVAVDDHYIYWTNGAAGTIGRANLDGSGVDQNFITGASDPSGVAVDEQHIYWANTNARAIGRANLDGSGVETSFITGLGLAPAAVAVDDHHLYWTSYAGAMVGRANLDASGVDQSFIRTAGFSYGVAVDRVALYWTNGAQRARAIGRANLNPPGSGADQSFITTGEQNPPTELASDGAHIYWTTARFNGPIRRANLDGSGVDQNFIAISGQAAGVAVDAGSAPAVPGGSRVVKHRSKITIASYPALHGRVKSSLRACERRRAVKLFLQRPHRHDKLVGRDRTNRRGRWKVEPKFYGAYYAKVTRRELKIKGKTHVCRSARSRSFSYGPGP